MENKELKTKKMKVPLLDKILSGIAVAAFITIVICGIFETAIGLFISITFAFTLSLCVLPIIEYIRKAATRKRTENLRQARGIGFVVTLVGSIIFLAHRVIFSESITKDRYYWIYDYIAWYVIISFIVIKIIDTVKRIKNQIREKSGLNRYAGTALSSILFTLFIFVIPISKYYVPRKVINLGNIEKSNKFLYSQISESRSKDLDKKYSTSGTIVDDKLAELFQREMSNVKVENIRKLDKMNFELKNMKSKYLAITPFYNEIANRTNIRYIDYIRIYENGEVVSYDFNSNLFFGSHDCFYRLNLSSEFIDGIRRAVEENQKQSK